MTPFRHKEDDKIHRRAAKAALADEICRAAFIRIGNRFGCASAFAYALGGSQIRRTRRWI